MTGTPHARPLIHMRGPRFFILLKQKPLLERNGFRLFNGATAYFPVGMHQSIIGADVFHGLVRNGAGWYNVAFVTHKKTSERKNG